MATRIELDLPDGTRQVFESDWFTGYHKVEAEDGFCIVKKTWFSQPETVLCVRDPAKTTAKVESCEVCELLNPSQQL